MTQQQNRIHLIIDPTIGIRQDLEQAHCTILSLEDHIEVILPEGTEKTGTRKTEYTDASDTLTQRCIDVTYVLTRHEEDGTPIEVVFTHCTDEYLTIGRTYVALALDSIDPREQPF